MTASPNNSSSLPSAHGRRVWLVIVMVCLAAGGVIWWYAGLRNRFIPDNFGVVEPGRIYRSAQIHRRILRQTLLDNHIKVIVDLSQENSSNAQAERQIARDMGIRRVQIRNLAGTGTGDPNGYIQAIEAIADADRHGQAVLVHCQSGAERTGGVIAVYRMLVEGKSRDQAYAEAERFHHRPHSNPKLYPFIESNLAAWRTQLQTAGIVPAGRPVIPGSGVSTTNP